MQRCPSHSVRSASLLATYWLFSQWPKRNSAPRTCIPTWAQLHGGRIPDSDVCAYTPLLFARPNLNQARQTQREYPTRILARRLDRQVPGDGGSSRLTDGDITGENFILQPDHEHPDTRELMAHSSCSGSVRKDSRCCCIVGYPERLPKKWYSVSFPRSVDRGNSEQNQSEIFHWVGWFFPGEDSLYLSHEWVDREAARRNQHPRRNLRVNRAVARSAVRLHRHHRHRGQPTANAEEVEKKEKTNKTAGTDLKVRNHREWLP